MAGSSSGANRADGAGCDGAAYARPQASVNRGGEDMYAKKSAAGGDPRAGEVLIFWFGEGSGYGTRRKAWFEKDPAFDAAIRSRFLALYEDAAAGRLATWKERPADCLALVIVLDQFPRNMFRATARAFAADALALGAARHAVDAGYDTGLLAVERLFLYLPFEHSESLDDQWRALALMARLAPWPETADAYPYAVRHWEIVRRFGRFPHRNAILERASTPQEIEFLKTPGSGF
jgi:uncharacterized protein (DUF924 family)